MNAPVVEVLRRARDLYAASPSHAHPARMPEDGTYCVLTATAAAARAICKDDMFALDVDFEAEDVLGRVTGMRSLARWNYEQSTSTVLGAFDQAIALAEQEKETHGG